MRCYQSGGSRPLQEPQTVSAIEAFDELYRRHSPKAYGYLKSRTASSEEAQDLLQAGFLKLHRSRHLFDSSQAFLPWFWCILRSVLTDSQRKEKRNPAKPAKTLEESQDVLEAIPAPVAFETTIASLKDFDALNPIVTALKPDQRHLLELRASQGKSFEEIAQELQITPTTARQRMSRLLKHLKTSLKRGPKP
jgi:RNA polymerase sigma-70 factor (ECF subfamily)